MDKVFINKSELNKWIARYFPDQNLISIEDLLNTIENLDIEVENLQKMYDELYNNLQNNYKPISQAEQYEISDRDFI